MWHKKFNHKDLATEFFNQKIDSFKKKFVYVLNYLQTFKAVHRNNPRNPQLTTTK